MDNVCFETVCAMLDGNLTTRHVAQNIGNLNIWNSLLPGVRSQIANDINVSFKTNPFINHVSDV